MTLQDCIPYQCGFDPMNQAVRYACSIQGYAGVRSCADPVCAPYCSQGNAPEVARAAAAIHYPAVLTPQNLVRPVPAITDALHAIPVATADGWCGVNRAIANNPLIAVGALALAFWIVRAHGR